MAPKAMSLLLATLLLLITTKVSYGETDPPAQVLPPPPFPVPFPPSPAPVPVLVPPPPPALPPPVRNLPVPTPSIKPNPPVKSLHDCVPLCDARCAMHSRQNVCKRACMTCCGRCKCVPPGTYGNRELCGKCYSEMKTHNNQLKCP